MTHPDKENKLTLLVPVVEENEGCAPEGGDPPPSGKRLSSEEEWRLNKAAVGRFSRNGQWKEALELLTALSKKQKSHEIYKALAMRVWIALKTDAAVTDVVLALFHLLNTLGPQHEVAGPIAALAHLMAKHRTPDHPDRALAQGQSQQMFSLVMDSVGIVGDDAFKKWVAQNRLDDPEYYVPIVLNCLEVMVGDEWWIDREALQRDAMGGPSTKKTTTVIPLVNKTLQ
ncbi:MAG: hypothetical protein HQL80_02745 [Magnetococcales bacterium]|nr:hypothetical protein [Magnetococcales bacterium]